MNEVGMILCGCGQVICVLVTLSLHLSLIAGEGGRSLCKLIGMVGEAINSNTRFNTASHGE